MDSARDFAAIAQEFRALLGSALKELLHELGTLLRSADARRSPDIRPLLPAVVAAYPRHPPEVLRVLINYTADNVANRNEVLQEDGFWARALQLSPAEHVKDLSLLMVLINQYLRSVEEAQLLEFMGRLCERGCQRWVMSYYRQLWRDLEHVHSLEEVDFDRPLEFVREWSRLSPVLVDASDFVDGYTRFASASMSGLVAVGSGAGQFDFSIDANDLDSLDDLLLAYSEIIFNCTNVPDSGAYSFGVMVECLGLPLPLKLPHFLNVRRNLFAACGNIASYPSYNNGADIEANLDRISASPDAYVVSACAISLGNCISSLDLQAQFLASHNSRGAVGDALVKILHTSFMDVIQFQAFHFFNNALTVDLARPIVAADNARHLLRQTKIIADNASYYKDVALVYLKFLRKLTVLGFQSLPPIDFLPYKEAYEFLLPVDDAAEVEYLVLEILCKEKTPVVADFKKELVEKVLVMDSALPAGHLLSKIKALAVFIKLHTPEEVYELYDADLADYLSHLDTFVRLLASMPATDEPRAEAGVIANNTKFIAISIKGHVEDLLEHRNDYAGPIQGIVAACMELLRLPRT